MMTAVLIRNARIVQRDNQLKDVDVWIESGVIKAIGQQLTLEGEHEVIDAKKRLLTPGLVDVHVHLREPGFEKKETIRTGTLAAARGGVTTVCAMPNLNPVPDTVEIYDKVSEKIKQEALVNVYQYAPITKSLKSDEIVDMESLHQAGAFAFTNDGVGVQSAGTMYLAMKEAARLNVPIVAHTEDNSLLFGGVIHEGTRNHELNLPGILSVAESSQIARDLMLAEATGVHYHVCHLSTKEGVRIIRDAKRAGINVTCEVTPHHLLLNETDIAEDSGRYKMNPPLRSIEDQAALINGLLDGTIDCIATDHAPHQACEKQTSMKEAAFGIVGIEDAFALLYTHFVKAGIFTLEQLVNWMSQSAAAIFDFNAGKLEVGAPANLALFDLDKSHVIAEDDFVSLGHCSPFIGIEVYGRAVMTMVDGQVVWEE